MTAVAAFPSAPRGAGWANASQTSLNQMTPDEVARLFMPRKGSQRGAPDQAPGPGAVWATGQMRANGLGPGAPQGHDGGPQMNSGGSLKSKKSTRGAPWPQKAGGPGDMMRPGMGSHSANGTLSSSSMGPLHQSAPILPSQHRSLPQNQPNGTENPGTSFLMLRPLNNSFEPKFIPLPYYPDTLRIGRQTNAKTLPTSSNGFFDSKVLSRQHAEVWADPKTGRVWIRDVKSSNGTFVNGQRLSQENRESEAHELRADDTLELGIDIYSEDNKSILHHKVLAKVEHAGFQTGPLHVDASALSEIDPIMGGALMSPQLTSLNNVFARGRSASQTSRSSMAGGGIAPRNLPLFLQSVSVEQIVKRLNTELHMAKQQSQELQRTSEFFDQLLSMEVVKKQPEIKATIITDCGQSPIIDSGVSLESTKFQPIQLTSLTAPGNHVTVTPEVEQEGVKEIEPEAENEIPKEEEVLSSPIFPLSPPAAKRSLERKHKPEPQHLFSLVTQLRDARLELEAKSARVKDLEDSLRREREAREQAEDRAAQLEYANMRNHKNKSPESEGTIDIMLDQDIEIDGDEDGDVRDDISVAGSEATVVRLVLDNDETSEAKNSNSTGEASPTAAQAAEAAAAQWQKRVEEMMAELKAAKDEIESYKKRVRTAEEEGEQSRRTLSEMVAKIRADEERKRKERRERGVQTEEQPEEPVVMVNCGVQAEPVVEAAENVEVPDVAVVHEGGHTGNGSVKVSNGAAVGPGGKEKGAGRPPHDGQQLTELIQKPIRRSVAKESAPYVSIVGVVIIGVGLMAILNTWQKVER